MAVRQCCEPPQDWAPAALLSVAQSSDNFTINTAKQINSGIHVQSIALVCLRTPIFRGEQMWRPPLQAFPLHCYRCFLTQCKKNYRCLNGGGGKISEISTVEGRDPINVPTERKAAIGIPLLLDSKNSHGQRMLQT